MNEWSDYAIASGIALMLQVLLGLLAFLAIAAVVKFVIDRVDASRPTLPRRKQSAITRIEPRCERAGSQEEFYRRMRARGAR